MLPGQAGPTRPPESGQMVAALRVAGMAKLPSPAPTSRITACQSGAAPVTPEQSRIGAPSKLPVQTATTCRGV